LSLFLALGPGQSRANDRSGGATIGTSNNTVSVFSPRTIRVLLAEVHRSGADDACGAIELDPRLRLVGCVSNAAEAVATAVELMPSVCVLDSDLPLGSLTAALEISTCLPTAGLVLRHGPDDDDLFEALHAGVTAYLPRTAPSSRLLRAIVSVAAGEAVLSGTQVARVLEAVRDPARARRHIADRPPLTAREWQVLELLRNRLTTAEIAERLVLSPVTVRSHAHSIRQKLGAASREEALELV
jgi:DNA-binding NarL/FixJ family response regulator